MSTLGTQRIARVNLSIPYYGTARADVVPENGAAPTVGASALTIVDLVLKGGILRADIDAPEQPHAVWVSGPGWDLPLAGRSYKASVQLKTILADLLSDVSAACAKEGYAAESYAAMPSNAAIAGCSGYVRLASTDKAPRTGRMALASLWRAGLIPPWWVAPDGSTHFDARQSGAAVGRNDIMRRNAAVGMRWFGCDSPVGFLPGTTLEGAATSRLIVKESAGSLTAEAWQ